MDWISLDWDKTGGISLVWVFRNAQQKRIVGVGTGNGSLQAL